MTERPGYPQRPRESRPALREIQTRLVGMQVRSPTGQPTASIRLELSVRHNDTQQVDPGRSAPASDAGAHGLGPSGFRL